MFQNRLDQALAREQAELANYSSDPGLFEWGFFFCHVCFGAMRLSLSGAFKWTPRGIACVVGGITGFSL